MIITALLNLVFSFLSVILSPLQNTADVVLDSNLTASLTTASGYLHSLNSFLPIDTMLEILGVLVAFEGGYLLFKLIMWVIKKIPTLN